MQKISNSLDDDLLVTSNAALSAKSVEFTVPLRSPVGSGTVYVLLISAGPTILLTAAQRVHVQVAASRESLKPGGPTG